LNKGGDFTVKLGKINYIKDLRAIWKHEEKEFTPWLAENIGLLGETLGLDLELISSEHGVGSFSLDILARDLGSGNLVAIENQLEVTDHNHLGQIMTYASGVDAKTVVWISKEVREEHRKAIDWINQITNEDIEFFAVEIELMQIDDSQPAPFFKVKASPNDWSKEQKKKVSVNTGISPRIEHCHNFFTNLLEQVQKEIPGFTNAKKANQDSWKSFPTGTSGLIYIIAFRSNNRISCELYLDTGDKDENKGQFDFLYSNKEAIEALIGILSWERLDEKRASRIAVYTEFTNDEAMIAWSIDQLKKFRAVFKEYIN
jgi:hypothetical protein